MRLAGEIVLHWERDAQEFETVTGKPRIGAAEDRDAVGPVDLVLTALHRFDLFFDQFVQRPSCISNKFHSFSIFLVNKEFSWNMMGLKTLFAGMRTDSMGFSV